METMNKIGLVFSMLFALFLNGCSSPKPSKIIAVDVAWYNSVDQATAMQLTFTMLHQHGIPAGGWGNGAIDNSCMHVCVPPNQAVLARKLLRSELAQLNQEQKNSFQIESQ